MSTKRRHHGSTLRSRLPAYLPVVDACGVFDITSSDSPRYIVLQFRFVVAVPYSDREMSSVRVCVVSFVYNLCWPCGVWTEHELKHACSVLFVLFRSLKFCDQ